MEPNPLDVSVVMLVRNKTVLIARRPPEVHLAGYWEFPGGKCQPGESPEACALREVREEIGVEIKVLEAWEMLKYDYPQQQVRLHPFVGKILSGEPYPLGCSELRWVNTEALSSYTFPEANGPLLERLAQVLFF